MEQCKLKHKLRIIIKLSIIVIITIVTSVIVYVILRTLTQVKKSATYSYIASVGSFLDERMKPLRGQIVDSLGEEWRLLTDTEYKYVAMVMGKSSKIDRGKLSHSPDKILYDHWGRHILIAARKTKWSRAEYIVLSKGKDGIAGTQDDTVSPRDAVFPTQFCKEKSLIQ